MKTQKQRIHQLLHLMNKAVSFNNAGIDRVGFSLQMFTGIEEAHKVSEYWMKTEKKLKKKYVIIKA